MAGEAGGRGAALVERRLGGGAVGHDADRGHVEAEEEVAHGGVAGHHELVDGRGVHGQGRDRAGQVAEERALQQPALLLSVEADAGHDVRAPEALGVLERVGGHEASRLQVVQAQGHRGGADVEGQAVERARGLAERLAVEEHEAAVAGDRGVEALRRARGGRPSPSRCAGCRAAGCGSARRPAPGARCGRRGGSGPRGGSPAGPGATAARRPSPPRPGTRGTCPA